MKYLFLILSICFCCSCKNNKDEIAIRAKKRFTENRSKLTDLINNLKNDTSFLQKGSMLKKFNIINFKYADNYEELDIDSIWASAAWCMPRSSNIKEYSIYSRIDDTRVFFAYTFCDTVITQNGYYEFKKDEGLHIYGLGDFWNLSYYDSDIK